MSPNNSSDRFRRFSRIHSIAAPLVTLRRPQLLSQCHVPDKRKSETEPLPEFRVAAARFYRGVGWRWSVIMATF
jgi:hypothetical protein